MKIKMVFMSIIRNNVVNNRDYLNYQLFEKYLFFPPFCKVKRHHEAHK